MSLLPEKKVSKILRDIYRGKINPKNLPKDIYFATAHHLVSGAYEGFGFDINTAKGKKLKQLLDLRENLYLFSGAKTYQQTVDMAAQLKREDGSYKTFKEFKESVLPIYEEYNVNWLKAEYETAIGQSRMAAQWDYIESTKNILPYLTFSTDGHACPECAPYEGLTRPVDDPIWDIATPLLHFNCMCILRQSDNADELSSDNFVRGLPIDDIPDLFAQNVGKTSEIFTKDHPYFQNAPKSAAKTNFNLPIPNEDQKSK